MESLDQFWRGLKADGHVPTGHLTTTVRIHGRGLESSVLGSPAAATQPGQLGVHQHHCQARA